MADEKTSEQIPIQVTLRFITRLGHQLLATGDSVSTIQIALNKVAKAYGLKRVNILALPTVLFVKFEDEGDTKIEFSSEGLFSPRFDQIRDIYELAQQAEAGQVNPRVGLERLETIYKKPPRFNAMMAVLGHALICMGLVLTFRPTLTELGSALFLGLLVGCMKQVALTRPLLSALLPTMVALVTGTAAFVSTKYGFGISSIKVIIASLVTFLPGGSMAMATAELSQGDMVSGSSRFVNALIKVVLLTLGLVTAAMIVKLPENAAFVFSPKDQLGPWAPWVGVLIFGIGHRLHFSTTHGDFWWILLALYIAYGVEVLADISFGGYMCVFLGAMAATPFAYFIQHQLKGPPMLITFLPALWLLVPTSVALIGLTEFVSSSQTSGFRDFVTTIFSIISCAIGSLMGMWIYSFLFDPLFEGAREISKRYSKKKP